jgi:hypothetical protein
VEGPSTTAAASAPTTAGIVVPSSGPSPSCPKPNNGGKGKGKEKGKNNGSSGFDNNNIDNSRGAPAWLSFYNPWTGTISMWSVMCPS